MSPAQAYIDVPELQRSPALRPAPSERRQHHRYPINAHTEYVLAGHRARATTLNISSGGVLLKTDEKLPVGSPIRVMTDWPVLLDQRCPLRLVIFGKILRSDAGVTAVGIIRYDFHLRPKSTVTFAA